MSGKGDVRRPRLVDRKRVEDNWDQTFGKKQKPKEEPKQETEPESSGD